MPPTELKHTSSGAMMVGPDETYTIPILTTTSPAPTTTTNGHHAVAAPTVFPLAASPFGDAFAAPPPSFPIHFNPHSKRTIDEISTASAAASLSVSTSSVAPDAAPDHDSCNGDADSSSGHQANGHKRIRSTPVSPGSNISSPPPPFIPSFTSSVSTSSQHGHHHHHHHAPTYLNVPGGKHSSTSPSLSASPPPMSPPVMALTIKPELKTSSGNNEGSRSPGDLAAHSKFLDMLNGLYVETQVASTSGGAPSSSSSTSASPLPTSPSGSVTSAGHGHGRAAGTKQMLSKDGTTLKLTSENGDWKDGTFVYFHFGRKGATQGILCLLATCPCSCIPIGVAWLRFVCVFHSWRSD
jgi:hypothetical protein